MKKYILSLMVAGLSVITFAFADTVQISCTPDGCTPYGENNPIPAPSESTTVKIVNDENCEDTSVQAVQVHPQYGPSYSSFENLQSGITWYANATLYFTMNPEESRGNCTVSIEGLPAYNGGNEGGNEGGSDNGTSSGSLLPGGTDGLTGIIGSLESSISEFIPYVVYIGLSVLGAVIGFVAIKWLINRVRAKVFGTFSGGRRRK